MSPDDRKGNQTKVSLSNIAETDKNASVSHFPTKNEKCDKICHRSRMRTKQICKYLLITLLYSDLAPIAMETAVIGWKLMPQSVKWAVALAI